MINSFYHGPLWWASHPAQEMVCVLRTVEHCTFIETARPWEQCRSNLQALGGNTNFWLMLETLGAESRTRNGEGSSPKDFHLRTAKRLSAGRDYTTDSSKQCQGAVSAGWEFQQGCSFQLGERCRTGRTEGMLCPCLDHSTGAKAGSGPDPQELAALAVPQQVYHCW